MGQFSAPGTAAAVAGAAVAALWVTGPAVAGAAAVTGAAVTPLAVRGAPVTLVVDGDAQPDADAATTTTAAAIQRPTMGTNRTHKKWPGAVKLQATTAT
jgi:hypothetical protein